MGKETLEEATELFFRKKQPKNCTTYKAAKFGAKWQAKRMYSKEEVIEHLNHLIMLPSSELDKFTNEEEMVTMK